MSQPSLRESRRVLRRIQDHWNRANEKLGAVRHPLGVVDVYVHPDSITADLNYVTPRRSTAWVSVKELQQGIDLLRSRERRARVLYIEGLYPPMFARTMHDLDLYVEREVPLMAYEHDTTVALPRIRPPGGVTLDVVNDTQGMALWWYVYRNAFFEVVTTTASPVVIGQDVWRSMNGSQVNAVMYRQGFPVGVSRMSVFKESESAQVVVMSMLQEQRSADMLRTLLQSALSEAVQRGAQLIFTAGNHAVDREVSREVGFVDRGSLVCYADGKPSQHKDSPYDSMEHPVFTIR